VGRAPENPPVEKERLQPASCRGFPKALGLIGERGVECNPAAPIDQQRDDHVGGVTSAADGYTGKAGGSHIVKFSLHIITGYYQYYSMSLTNFPAFRIIIFIFFP
jgi:hypothetical protein